MALSLKDRERSSAEQVIESQQADGEQTIDLLELLYYLLEKAKWIVLVALIGAILAASYSFFIATPIYEATAKLYVLNSKDSALNLSDLQIGSYLATDYQQVFKTWEVHEMVAQELNLSYTYAQLEKMLRITNPAGTRILEITAASEDAHEAEAIANAYAQVAKKYIHTTMATEEPNVMSVALKPMRPVSPNKTRNTMLGFLLGALLMGALFVVMFVLDDKIKTADDIARYTGLATLAVVPAMDAAANGKEERAPVHEPVAPSDMPVMELSRFTPLDYACTEAMNTLCTNLAFAGNGIKKIMFTSSMASEGKSFITMNAMRTLANLGKKVVLVDIDLRRSMLKSRFGMRLVSGTGKGLAHYLAGMCSAEEILYATNIPRAYIVTIGHEVSNSLSLLNNPRLPKLLDQLAQSFDFVLVDVPPVGVIIDAAEIAKSCDGTLLIVSHKQARRREVLDSKLQIERTGCMVLGTVLNNVKLDSISSKKYYKSKYATYYTATTDKRPPAKPVQSKANDKAPRAPKKQK